MRSGVVIVPILWRLTFGSLRWYQDLGRGKVQHVGWDLAIIFNIWYFVCLLVTILVFGEVLKKLAFLMIFHINYSIAMCAAVVYLVHRNLEVSKTASSIDMDQHWQEAQIVDSIRDLTWSPTWNRSWRTTNITFEFGSLTTLIPKRGTSRIARMVYFHLLYQDVFWQLNFQQSYVCISPNLTELGYRHFQEILPQFCQDLGIITIGIAAYRVSEMELDHMFDGIGFLGVPNRVSMENYCFFTVPPCC